MAVIPGSKPDRLSIPPPLPCHSGILTYVRSGRRFYFTAGRKSSRAAPCLLRFHVPLSQSQPTERAGRKREREWESVPASCRKQPANLLINKQSAQVDSFIQGIKQHWSGKNWRKTVSVVDKCQTFLPAAMATLFQHFPRIFLSHLPQPPSHSLLPGIFCMRLTSQHANVTSTRSSVVFPHSCCSCHSSESWIPGEQSVSYM